MVPSNKAQFCSLACYRSFTGENRLEARVRESLQRLGIRFVQEMRVGRWSIDFALCDANVALEVDGGYWHRRTAERDRKRDEALAQRGWRTVRLAEDDILAAADLDALVAQAASQTAVDALT